MIKGNLKDISINFEEKENEINENEYETIVTFDMSGSAKEKEKNNKKNEEIKKINVENFDKNKNVNLNVNVTNNEVDNKISSESADEFLCLICQIKFKTSEKLKIHELYQHQNYALPSGINHFLQLVITYA